MNVQKYIFKMTEKLIRNLCDKANILLVFLFVFNFQQPVYAWDVAVATSHDLSLFQENADTASKTFETHKITDLYALAYDPVQERFIFSVNHRSDMANVSIYTYHLATRNLTAVLPRQEYEAQSMVFEPEQSTLYWTDGNGHTIWSMHLLEGQTAAAPDVKPTRFLVLPDEEPTGIAISQCQRFLFWANRNHLNPSVDRVSLDGSGHIRIITKDLFQPMGVTVDETHAKLYWTDDQEGIYYRIERSNLDGSGRELMVRRTDQEPLSIAAFQNTVYWTDISRDSIWMISSDMSFPNHTKAKLEPNLFYKFKAIQPNNIVSFSSGLFNCSRVQPLVLPDIDVPEIVVQPESNTEYCLNSGDLRGESCTCKKGFVGVRCETSVCYHFCLNGGQCYLDKSGSAQCRCLPGYQGERCHSDSCEGYCLHQGRCYVSNDTLPRCSCTGGYTGERCETNMTSSDTLQASLLLPIDCVQLQYIFISLVALCLLLIVTVIGLILHMRHIKRTRLKKRRLIFKNPGKVQTPMTARPPPPDQCEISIENCCNMNICETPCFEPSLRTPSNKGERKKTEDKKNLLRSMEEDVEEPFDT